MTNERDGDDMLGAYQRPNRLATRLHRKIAELERAADSTGVHSFAAQVLREVLSPSTSAPGAPGHADPAQGDLGPTPWPTSDPVGDRVAWVLRDELQPGAADNTGGTPAARDRRGRPLQRGDWVRYHSTGSVHSKPGTLHTCRYLGAYPGDDKTALVHDYVTEHPEAVSCRVLRKMTTKQVRTWVRARHYARHLMGGKGGDMHVGRSGWPEDATSASVRAWLEGRQEDGEQGPVHVRVRHSDADAMVRKVVRGAMGPTGNGAADLDAINAALSRGAGRPDVDPSAAWPQDVFDEAERTYQQARGDRVLYSPRRHGKSWAQRYASRRLEEKAQRERDAESAQRAAHDDDFAMYRRALRADREEYEVDVTAGGLRSTFYQHMRELLECVSPNAAHIKAVLRMALEQYSQRYNMEEGGEFASPHHAISGQD